MLVSVLIPLEFHRDQAVECIRKWRTEQTVDPAVFEIILVASERAEAGELEKVRALLGPDDRLILSKVAHDIGQVAEAARHAKTELLFFTESHVLPSPSVLAQALETFEQHPDWAGFSCRTHGVTPNALAAAEARMYEADIHYGMTVHPWRKILDQCFVTRRAAYEAAGGFDGSLGHFAEWVLAARYAELGLKIGYAPEIDLTHYYTGDIPTLLEFTEDFAAGEMTFWERAHDGRAGAFMEPPPEWWRQGERRSDLVRHLLKVASRHDRASQGNGVSSSELRAVWIRRGAAAFAGSAWDRCRARLDLLWKRWRLTVASALGGTNLDRALQDFIAAAVRVRRLQPARMANGASADSLWSASPADASRGCGFHFPEIFESVPFRWSKELAVLDLALLPGRHRLCVETLVHKLTTTGKTPAFYFNGRRIPDEKVRYKDGRFVFQVKQSNEERAKLAWVSDRQPAPGDPRHLGLPVVKVSLVE